MNFQKNAFFISLCWICNIGLFLFAHLVVQHCCNVGFSANFLFDFLCRAYNLPAKSKSWRKIWIVSEGPKKLSILKNGLWQQTMLLSSSTLWSFAKISFPKMVKTHSFRLFAHRGVKSVVSKKCYNLWKDLTPSYRLNPELILPLARFWLFR